MQTVKELSKKAVVGWHGFLEQPTSYEEAEAAVKQIPRRFRTYKVTWLFSYISFDPIIVVQIKWN